MLTCRTCGASIGLDRVHKCPGFQKPTPDPLRAALVAIQELHKPYQPTRATAVYCAHCFEDGGYDGALHVLYPCPTRRLADDALTAHTTKNGDAP